MTCMYVCNVVSMTLHYIRTYIRTYIHTYVRTYMRRVCKTATHMARSGFVGSSVFNNMCFCGVHCLLPAGLRDREGDGFIGSRNRTPQTPQPNPPAPPQPADLNKSAEPTPAKATREKLASSSKQQAEEGIIHLEA